MTPAVVPVTLIAKLQDAFAASVAPVKLTDPDAAVAAIVPPPQAPVNPFGVATTNPVGRESVKAIALVASPSSGGAVMVKLRLLLPPTAMVAKPNDLAIEGAS